MVWGDTSGGNVLRRRLTGMDESDKFSLWLQRSGRCKRRDGENKEQRYKIWCSRVLFEVVRGETRDGSERINNTSEPRMAKNNNFSQVARGIRSL
jgi:hypothetical protein